MSDRPRVALFATCLVDLFRPSVGFAAAKLLDEAGCDVEVPRAQTCCGQPAFNSGDRTTARAMAVDIIETFEDFDYVVAPSGSCTGMLRVHLPELFNDDPAMSPRADALARRCHELISFLVDIRGVSTTSGAIEGSLTYHDSCSGLRELGIQEQPRKLLRASEGVSLVEMKQPEVCCGFGGTSEAYYVNREFEAALNGFRQLVEGYPDSSRLPEAMLKIGYIQYDIGAYDEAASTFQDILSRFPGHQVTVSAETRLRRIQQTIQ